MRAVIQRVSRASVRVGSDTIGSIDQGLLVFLGVDRADDDADLDWMIGKILGLRIFEDGEGRMNQSVVEVVGGVLAISQFTVFGNVRKGMRPSFNRAAEPETAKATYLRFVEKMGEELGRPAEAGRFGASMEIDAVNDGPVTIVIDSKDKRF
ncbi:MAG: D-tyrosyl-tRNA(Tyr) deacylase [Opitutales bacterium]|nr:D-tyrosyl-tRNA(Tyr) deacylase [Opitutales bacterium]